MSGCQHRWFFTNRRGSLSELFDATFGWLEHKDLRTPSREFRMMLQSYRASNTGMSIAKLARRKSTDCFFQNFRCMQLSRHFTIYRYDVSKAT
jgi:hypothetical protein